MFKKIFNLNSLIILLAVAIITVVFLWGYFTQWRYWVVSSPGTGPVPALGVATPGTFEANDKQLLVQRYIFSNYPKISKDLCSPDFWKTLDFVWNMTCTDSVTPDAQSYIPNPSKTNKGNAVFRHIVRQFQMAIVPDQTCKWLTFSPDLNTIKDSTPTAGFTYKPTDSFVKMGNISLPLFDMYLLPLCSWHMNSSLSSKVNAIAVNRYPQGHLRTRALAYAAPGTANEIISPGVLPGVDSVIINSGFKSNSSVEVIHCDTHLTSMASSLDCLNSCDLLGNTCGSHGPPGVGYGKWVYYARGSGLFTNLGKTIVFQNKIDAIMGSINVWDGKDARDKGAYVDDAYKGTLKGTFDSSKLESWQRFVADKDGTVKLALQTLLTGSCLSPPPIGKKIPGKPTTAKISLLDSDQRKNNCYDYLGIGTENYNTGPCASNAKYPCIYDAKTPSNKCNETVVALWWFWADDGSHQGNWGLLAPLAPQKFTEPSDICAWVLWACVNGYDFATNPEGYSWGDAVTNKYLNSNFNPKQSADNSIMLNSFLSNMSNSGYTTDDFLINLANYMKLDSVQLTTSQILGNVIGFEIFIFSGTVNNKNSDSAAWVCDRVDNDANMECIGSPGEKSNWLGGEKSLFFLKDPLSGTDTDLGIMTVTKNKCFSTGYFLDGPVTAYSDSGGVGAPLSDLIFECSNN